MGAADDREEAVSILAVHQFTSDGDARCTCSAQVPNSMVDAERWMASHQVEALCSSLPGVPR